MSDERSECVVVTFKCAPGFKAAIIEAATAKYTGLSSYVRQSLAEAMHRDRARRRAADER
jgi:hypothetical protein